MRTAIAGLVLGVCLVAPSLAFASSAPKAHFEWQGRIYDQKLVQTGGESLENWIDVDWHARVETKLESDTLPIRRYSITSVSLEISFQYLTFSTNYPPASLIEESYGCS